MCHPVIAFFPWKSLTKRIFSKNTKLNSVSIIMEVGFNDFYKNKKTFIDGQFIDSTFHRH